jgi:hypothetical protein
MMMKAGERTVEQKLRRAEDRKKENSKKTLYSEK